MEEVRIWEEEVIIPTYEIGAAEKNPILKNEYIREVPEGYIHIRLLKK